MKLCKIIWQPIELYRKSIFVPHTLTHKDIDREIVRERLSKNVYRTTTLPTVEHVHIEIMRFLWGFHRNFIYIFVDSLKPSNENEKANKHRTAAQQHFDVALLSTTEQFGKPICKDSIFVRRLKIITASVKARAYNTKYNTRVARSIRCLWMKLCIEFHRLQLYHKHLPKQNEK